MQRKQRVQLWAGQKTRDSKGKVDVMWAEQQAQWLLDLDFGSGSAILLTLTDLL